MLSCTFKQGDIFQEDVLALVNPVDGTGVMGAGLAKKFQENFPDNYQAYLDACIHSRGFPGGNLHLYFNISRNPVLSTSPAGNEVLVDMRLDCKFIFNMATKRRWQENSKLEYIAIGMYNLVTRIQELNITSVAIPALGCGLGGLDWGDVRPVILERLQKLPADSDVRVTVFEPR